MSGYRLYCSNIDLSSEKRSPDRSEGIINIWIIDISSQSAALAKLEEMLSSAERTHAARFHQDKDAQQFIVTRAILRILLADTLSVRPQDIDITTSEYKKPVLSKNNDVYFNVSHADNRAVIAIAKQRIGIDVEFLKSGFDYHAIAAYAFSGSESDHLAKSENPHAEFFRLWTRKEAFLKGIGTGLINDLKLISCLDAANEIPAVIKGITSDWQLSTVDLGSAYIMSIAFERASLSNQIFLFDFSHAAL